MIREVFAYSAPLYFRANANLHLWPLRYTRWPFTKEVKAAAAAAGVRLVTLAEIEPLLLAARSQRRWELDNPQPTEIEF